MQITIECIADNKVQFVSSYGKAEGVWMDENPQVMKEYYVEFEVKDMLLTDDFSLSNLEESSFDFSNGKKRITAQLIDYENDGCASFLLGDTILDITTKYNDAFLKLKDCYLTFQIKELYLYNVEI